MIHVQQNQHTLKDTLSVIFIKVFPMLKLHMKWQNAVESADRRLYVMESLFIQMMCLLKMANLVMVEVKKKKHRVLKGEVPQLEVKLDSGVREAKL